MLKFVPREESIVNGIMRYLKSRGDCRAVKRHGDPMTLRGLPDIYFVLEVTIHIPKVAGIAVVYGFRPLKVPIHCEVEVKRPGEDPTALQKAQLRQWSELSVPTLVATSVEDVKQFVEEIIEHFR